MSDMPSQDFSPSQLRVLQIITAALAFGMATFLVIVLILQQQQPAVPVAGTPLISPMAAIQFVLLFCLWLYLPGVLVRQGVVRMARQPADPTEEASRLLILKQTTHIVGCALIEGAGFFALIAYLVEREPYALGIALACLALLLVSFPTRERMRLWLLTQQDRLEDLRRMG